MILKKFISGGTMGTLFIILSAVISLFSMPILIHSLGNHNYSLFSLIGSLVGICTLIDFGFNRAFNQFLSSAYGRKEQVSIDTIVSIGLVVNYTLALLLVFLIVLTSWLSSTFWITELNDKSLFVIVMLISGINSAIRFPIRVTGEILCLNIHYDWMAIGSMVETCLRVGLSVMLVLNGYGLIAIALISLITASLEGLWKFILVKRTTPEIKLTVRNFNWSVMKSMYRYSFVAFFSETADKLKYQILPLLVVNLVSLNSLVFLTIAQRLLDYGSLFVVTWSGMLTTIFGQLHGNQDQVQLEKILRQGTSLLTIVVSYLGLCLFLFSGPFISVWLGPDFNLSVEILLILIVPTCISSVMLLSKEFMFGIAKIKGLMILHILELVLMLSFAIPLGYFFGLKGIAWSIFISITSLEIIGVIWLISRVIQSSWYTIYGDSFIIVAKFWAFASVVIVFIKPFIESSLGSLLLMNLLLGLIFIPIVWLLLPLPVQLKLRSQFA